MKAKQSFTSCNTLSRNRFGGLAEIDHPQLMRQVIGVAQPKKGNGMIKYYRIKGEHYDDFGCRDFSESIITAHDFESIVADWTVSHEDALEMVEPAFTKVWKVFGREGHRQRESFGESYRWNFSEEDIGVRIIEVDCEDITGTNDYVIVRITRETERECDSEFFGQLSDGIFENSNYGKIEVVEY